MSTIDRLDRMHADATPGDWHACHANREIKGVCPCLSVCAESGLSLVRHSMDGWGNPKMTFDKMSRADREQAAHNLDLIAALKNAWPALAAYVRALEEERDASREVMRHRDRMLWLCDENTGEDIEAVRVTRLSTDSARAAVEKEWM